jgi:GDP-mannose 6-dehydrogenase
MNISIVGLGYVGTVSAACLAARGNRVWGVDINPQKVRLINEGRSPIIEEGLTEKITQARYAGYLSATGDIETALRETDICLVSVATPSRHSGQIDPTHLFRACEEIANALIKLGRSQIVVVRSSVLPSTLDHCEHIFNAIAPGRAELSVNPEFLREGTAVRDFEDAPFTLLGVESASVEMSLRCLYSEFAAPIQVLPIKEALLVKYACNAYHALKVAFANEIGAVCQHNGIDGRAVMSVFCKDKKLNISTRYLMPGFAFGGSCLPKDVRAILYAAKQRDLELPLIEALLTSNEKVIQRAVREVIATGAHRIGLIGLSFKSSTDDLRESPFVELAERLLGKGYAVTIYDPNVSLARLTGSNKEYIDRIIPHLSRLLVRSLDDLIGCESIVVGNCYVGIDDFLDRAEARIIDLTGKYSLLAAREVALVP